MGINAQKRGSRKASRIEQRRVAKVAVATARNIRMTPLKVRHVIDLIRGKDFTEAVAILNFTPNIATEPILKLLNSAAANADLNLHEEPTNLYVQSCYVDGGFTFKRMHPTTMGRARIIRKRTSHITIQLAVYPSKSNVRVGGSN